MIKKTAMTLLALFCFLTAARAIEVQIGNESNLENAIPLYLNNNYSLTQQIYTAAEIGKAGGKAGTINSIAFYYHSSTSFSIEGVQMYMKLVDKDCFNSKWDMVAINASDKVWEGTFSATGAGWVTINLTQPFEYDGIRNLLVCLYDPKDGKPFTSPANYFRVNRTTKCTSVYYFNDFYKPSLENNNYYNGDSNSIYYHCNIKLDITPNVCDTPTNFAVSDITPNGATFTWESEAGNYVFEYKKTSDTNWTVINGLSQCTYTLSTLAPATDYDIRVKAVCGAGKESDYYPSSFRTNEVCPEGKVCIGQGTQLGDYMPFNQFAYSITQQIYTADEIGQDGIITSLDFFKAGTFATSANLDIYITSTNLDELNDWIPVTAADRVFSGNVNFVGDDWTTITLEKSFAYDGVSNIAILVDNNTGITRSWDEVPQFYVFTSSNQSLQWRDNNDLVPSSNTQKTFLDEKNRIRLGMEEMPCSMPYNLTVDYTGGTTVQVSWQSDGGLWWVALVDENDNYIRKYVFNTPNTIFENLKLNTTYRVEVCTVCNGGKPSEWTAPVTFTTDACMPEDKCEIVLELTDSYGDGWNGNKIQVVDVEKDIVLGTFANENLDNNISGGEETNTLYLYVCPGRKIKFEWISGEWVSECSYVVSYAGGREIFKGSGALLSPVTHIVDCNTTGDANGDTDLDIKDVLAVVDYILGNAPEGFIEANADIDGVEGITISDAVAILNLILAGH